MAGSALPQGVTLSRPAVLLATWFGVGLLPKAPGTWGSLAALPFAWVIHREAGPLALAVAAAILFLIGWWASESYVRLSGDKDPQAVVIDEVAAQWLVLAVAPLSFWHFAAGFVFFRAADIIKPFPASWAERALPGGLGVMADDVLAAPYAIACVLALGYVFR
jgi:phosphatidylglycerophosphatase A